MIFEYEYYLATFFGALISHIHAKIKIAAMRLWSEKDLFGGSITSEVPTSWRDVSDVRQVPDNQEVFQSTEGACLIIEVVEYQKQVLDEDAAAFFFNDLAETNGEEAVQSSRFDRAPKLADERLVPRLRNATNPVRVCVGAGVQKVSKGGNGQTQSETWIDVELCAVRLKHVTTDLVITLSTPSQQPVQPRSSYSDVFLRVLSTLEIKDWGLFSED